MQKKDAPRTEQVANEISKFVIVENVQLPQRNVPFKYFVSAPRKTGLCTTAHIHEYIEILYCLSGEYSVILNNVTHSFTKGDLIVINPNMVHIIHVHKIGDYSVFQFPPNFLYTAVHSAIEPKYILPFVTQDTAAQNHFTNAELCNTILPETLKKISEEFSEQRYGYEFALKIYSEQIFLWILRKWNEQGFTLRESYTDKKWTQTINKVLDYVWENYDQNITAKDMAKMCFVTYGHFSSVFKKATGQAFVKYLNNVRLMQSKKLLLKTDLSVTEIAQQTGFSTSSYYIEQFKKTEGLSPHKYRKING